MMEELRPPYLSEFQIRGDIGDIKDNLKITFSYLLMKTYYVVTSRLLINSIFGVFYSYFWAGDSCFSKNFFKFTLWDFYFFYNMSVGLLFSKS